MDNFGPESMDSLFLNQVFHYGVPKFFVIRLCNYLYETLEFAQLCIGMFEHVEK